MVTKTQSTSDLRSAIGTFPDGLDPRCARCYLPLPIAKDGGKANSDERAKLAITLCEDCWHWLLTIMIGPILRQTIDEAAPNRSSLVNGVREALQSEVRASLNLLWSASQAPARSKAKKPAELFDSIPKHIDYWRRVREARKDYEKNVSERYGRSVEFAVLMSAAVAQRRFWRRYFRRRFRYDPVSRKQLPGANLEIARRTALELSLWEYADRLYYTYDAAFWDGLSALFNLIKNGRDVQTNIGEVTEAVRATLQNFEVEAAERRIACRFPPLVEHALAKVSGWMRLRVKTDLNKRIWNAYIADRDTPSQKIDDWLISRLPTEILLARSQREPKEPLDSGSRGKSLVSRVAAGLESRRPELPKTVKKGCAASDVAWPVEDTPDDKAQEFLRRSEARIDIAKLEANANLSARETKVLAMLRENEDRSDIATRLDISVTNVHTIESRMRSKLRRACGPEKLTRKLL